MRSARTAFKGGSGRTSILYPGFLAQIFCGGLRDGGIIGQRPKLPGWAGLACPEM
jgi:hypothetical protein